MTKPSSCWRLLGLASALALAACGPSERAACPNPAATSRVNLRLVVDPPGPRPAQGADVLRDLDGAPVTVAREVAVSGRHILRTVRTYAENQQPALAMRFDEVGVGQISKATAKPGGGRLALVFDDRVVSSARCDGPVNTRAIQVTLSRTSDEAAVLATRIDAALADCVAPPEAR